MKCPKCEFENLEGMQFCGKCGSRLERICVACNFSNPEDYTYCGKCGQPLDESEEPPGIDYSEPKSYTPKFLAEKILTTRSSIEGERKFVTVLFADVANYTSIAEKIDPEEVHQMMDGCFKILMDEIHKYEGTINQFTGDGVMALFGAPVAHEDHAQRACYAALSIQKALGEYRKKIERSHGVDFNLRIGLNSGHVVVGSIGDDLRMDYTAVGDTTNVASRMQSMAHPGSILVSQTTSKIVRDYFAFESMGQVEIKGKEAPMEALKLIEASKVETRIAASVAKGLTRFVGRKDSMAALLAAYEKARSGAGQVLGIVGEAGVGKSRLLMEFRNRLAEGEVTYLEGRCLQYGGSIIYLPILDILKSYFDIKEGDCEHIIKKKMSERICHLDEALMESLSPLHEILSLKVEDKAFFELEPKQKRERIFEAIRDIVIRESQNQPLIVAVEDLHWIDKTSEEFLDYLIGWLANASILLILLYRPEYTHQWGSKSYYRHIGLDQLSVESSSKLVRAILEGGEVAPELRELILERAAGNPLFMEEFTYTLLENDSIQKEDYGYVLSRNESEIQVPDTIQGIIAARMDRLEDNLKRTMQVASVIGRDFAFRILQTITGLREELKAHLLNLQGLEFIYEKSLFPELEYIFKHALTQEVAYNSLLLKRRKEIHEKIGQAIEQIYAERLEEFYEMLAYHYSKSEDYDKAYLYLKLSGEKSERNYSAWEAFRFYKAAYEVLKKKPENRENLQRQLEVLHSILGPMRLLAYPEDSLGILEEGEKLSRQIGHTRDRTAFFSRLGHYFTIREGEYSRGIDYSEKSFQEAEKIQDIELVAITAWNLCAAYAGAGRFVKTLAFVPKVISLLEKTKKQDEYFGEAANVYSVLKGHCGFCMGFTGSFEQGEACFDEGLKSAFRLKDRTALGLLEYFFGFFFLEKGDWENAIKHFRSSIKHIEEVKYMTILGLAWSGIGSGYHLAGEFKTARKNIEKGKRIHDETGLPLWSFFHFLLLGKVHFGLGDFQKAHTYIKEALRLSEDNQNPFHATSKIWQGRILQELATISHGWIEEHILEAIRTLDEFKFRPRVAEGHFHLGELYTTWGQEEKALESMNKAGDMFQEMGMEYWLSKTQEAKTKLLGN